ncbi:2'-5' RNA ligase family protein [Spongiivirga sp. MCCC 1A20706]|uniref:2'-5' RNA ligase family protein n=1 Tax=Spongiivirga sp. MCCC 1A20706 TaxID=3160963 RepID=UPI003977C036
MNDEIKIYNLRIVPDEPVFSEIEGFKRKFENNFGKQPLSRSKPHITLAQFLMDKSYENELIQILNQLSSFPQCMIEIVGFKTFETSKTLYLDVVKSEELAALHKQLQIIFMRDLHRRKHFRITNKPHITISKTLNKEMLYDCKSHYDRLTYKRQFVVKEISLVSRFQHKTWNIIHKIPLTITS